MSDLQCAATVIVARHGEAEYESELLWDAGGSLTALGRQQARDLGESLADRRIAGIVCSDMSRAVQTAEIAASVLGCGVRVRAGLREFAVGDLAGQPFSLDLFKPGMDSWRGGDLSVGMPGAETGADIMARMTAELDAVADSYRGETALVVCHAGVMHLALPRLARNVADDFHFEDSLHNCDTCELAADSDGWVLRDWGGEPVAG